MIRPTHDDTQAGTRRLSRLVVGLLLLMALTLAGSTAWAFWTGAGAGTGSATTATLNPPTTVVATFTPGLTSVGVSWSAPTAGLAPLGYYVTRTSGGVTAPVCASSPTALVTGLACADASVAVGTYRYAVTAAFRSWTAVSGNSNTVTVVADATAPVVTVATVNGVAAAFPLRINVALSSFGGACGRAPGDSATVTPLIDGAPAAPVSCGTGKTWTYTLTSPLSGDGTVTLSARQSDLTGNVGTATAARDVTIDRTAPTVVAIARTGAASVNTLPVSWTVTFSEPVSGVTAANFTLATQGLSGTAPTISIVTPGGPSPSSTWTVSTNATGATAVAGSIQLDLTNRVQIADRAANALATASSTGDSYAYDTTVPTVTKVTSPLTSGSYRAGQMIPVEVTFSELVNVTGSPQLTLATGVSGGTPVSYSSGSGSTVVTFNYTVDAGHTSADLNYLAVTSLVGTFRDAATNAATLTLPALGASSSLGGSTALVVDTTAPSVAAVSSTQLNGSYTAGRVIPITVTFTEPVTVTGSPQLTLATGAPGGTAVGYSSGSGSTTLTFNYTVAAGHTSAALNYLSTAALGLNGGTIADAATNAAALGLPPLGTAGSIAPTRVLIIDTSAPGVTVTTVNGTTPTFPWVTNGDMASIGGTCGTATGDAPTITVTVAGPTPSSVSLNCLSGSWTRNFVPALAAQGTYTLSATQVDAATNTGTAPARTVVIDKTGPAVTGVSSPLANGSYRVAQLIPVTVTFSEPVVVTGSPRLTLQTSPTASTAVSYASGSGTNTLTFNYTVAAGNASADLDYAAIGSLALNGGTLRDAVTNNATLTLPAPGAPGSLGASKDLVIDTTVPTVAGVSSQLADGSYRAGQVIPVEVTFSEPVNVTGTPQLALATGTPGTTAVAYTSGTGTSVLTFEYTVAPGNTSGDLNYAATTSLTLNGGSITDPAGNATVLNLPALGAASSLGGSKALIIDTTSPVVTVTRILRFPILFRNVRVSGTAEASAGPVTVFLCYNVGPPCDASNATQILTTAASGTWQSNYSAEGGQGTWYASATQADAAGNVGTSAVFGPYSN